MIAWSIVIIVVVVAVVSHLASLNKGQPPGAARPAGGNNAMARAKPTSSEIDRFLEEVNRRKQQQQDRRVPPPPPVQREPQRRPQIIDRPPVVAKPVTSPRQVIVAEPVFPAVIVAEPVLEPPPERMLTLTQLANIQVPATLTQKVDSPPIKQAKALLKTRDGMRSMFILNEILSTPRCKRPYRR